MEYLTNECDVNSCCRNLTQTARWITKDRDHTPYQRGRDGFQPPARLVLVAFGDRTKGCIYESVVSFMPLGEDLV